jgi:hypothetical protein
MFNIADYNNQQLLRLKSQHSADLGMAEQTDALLLKLSDE